MPKDAPAITAARNVRRTAITPVLLPFRLSSSVVLGRVGRCQRTRFHALRAQICKPCYQEFTNIGLIRAGT
jgi:hypothetical protein